MEVGEEEEEGGDEEDVEGPGAHAGAAITGEVVVEEDGEEGEGGPELEDLAISDHALPAGADAQGAQEVVGVHDDVNAAVGDEHHGEGRLGAVEADVAHDDDHGVMVDVEEGEAGGGGAKDDEEGVDELGHLGEVEDVAPEEERAGGRGGPWEAHHALQGQPWPGGSGKDGECAA